MIKRYCDNCGDEITKENKYKNTGITSKFKVKNTGDTVTIKLHVENNTGGPDVCKYCIIGSVKLMDDRDKCMEEK